MFAFSPFALDFERPACRSACRPRRAGHPLALFLDDPFFHAPTAAVIAKKLRVADIKLDVSESYDEIFVDADVPGFRREDIKVDLNGQVLTISASTATESATETAAATATEAESEEPMATATAEAAHDDADADTAEWEKLPKDDADIAEAKEDDATAVAEEVAQSAATHHLRERPQSYTASRRVSRSVRLPRAVDAAGAVASLENGVLHLRLPKVETRHEITIAE